MRNPVQRWQEYRPSKEQTLWIALGSIVATLIVGFGLLGWVTAGSAREQSEEAAAMVYQQLGAAVCVENFLRAANASERLAKLQATDWWQRDELVADAGWATLPGEDGPRIEVAGLCATRLGEHAEAQAKAKPLAAAR
jgi:hypothetical protein